jgi:hypothetical protein
MLEESIAELTKAVLALTYALNQHKAMITPITVKESVLLEPADFKAATALGLEVRAEVPNEKLNTTIDTSPPSESESAAVSYDDVKKATNALSAAKGRDTTIAALAHFGVDRATQLVEAQWEDYINFTKEQALL